MIKKVKLYVNVSKEKAVETADKVKQALLDNGYEIVEEGADLVIGFGGDGTLLKWLKLAAKSESIQQFEENM